jgi:hypothetical protein
MVAFGIVLALIGTLNLVITSSIYFVDIVNNDTVNYFIRWLYFGILHPKYHYIYLLISCYAFALTVLFHKRINHKFALYISVLTNISAIIIWVYTSMHQ